MSRLRPVVALVLVLATGSATALETDQYWAWGQPIDDSTAAVNARFNLELERAIADVSRQRGSPSCREIMVAYRKRMRYLLLHEIQLWAWNSRWVDRVPEGGDEFHEYEAGNLYSNHPLIDVGTWMPRTPTIEVDGVRFGTDKLAHMVSSGWTYYGVYRKALARGESAVEAERRAIDRGILEETLVLGRLFMGVLSIADVEASAAGMRFYLDLCDADDPVLVLEASGWVIARPVDVARYVTPRWDESFQPPIYRAGRWRKVRPVLESYCDRLGDPQVVAMRRRYRERDTRSLVGEMVAERVAEGTLEDPLQFGIDAVCGSHEVVTGGARVEQPAAAHSPSVRPSVWRDRLIAEESERSHRVLGLPGLQLSYPLVVSGSIAVMPTSQPADWECTTPCDFRGPFAQLETGLGGGKLSFGWARVSGVTDRSGSRLRAAFIGTAYKLTVLRTWGDQGWAEKGRTYAGLELGVPVAQAKVGLGLLYRVDRGDERRWLVSGGFGWGF